MDQTADQLVTTLLDTAVVQQLRKWGDREVKNMHSSRSRRLAHVSLLQRLLRLSDVYRGDDISSRVQIKFDVPQQWADKMKKMGTVPIQEAPTSPSDRGPAPTIAEVHKIFRETEARFPRDLDMTFKSEVLNLINVEAPKPPARFTTTI